MSTHRRPRGWSTRVAPAAAPPGLRVGRGDAEPADLAGRQPRRGLAAGQDARFDDPDPRDEPALHEYAATHGGLPGTTEHILAAGARLGALIEPCAQPPYTHRIPNRPPFLPATVRERGDVVIDGTVSWPGPVAGLGWYIHAAARDLAALRPRRT